MALDELFDQIKEEKISRRGVLKIGIGTGMAIAGAGLAGCTTPTPSPTATPLPTLAPTAAPVLKSPTGFAHLPSDHHAPLFVAAHKGADGKSMFDKHGLTVTMAPINTGPDIIKGVVKGDFDIGLVGCVPTISAIDSDPTIKIIAAVQSNGSGIIVGKDSTIASVADLKGKKIAIPSKGSIQDIMLRELLKKNGIDYEKDVSVSAVAAGQQVGALVAGTIDAAITWEPFVSTGVVNNSVKVLLRSEDIWPNHPCCCVATTTKMIKDYPDTIKAFLLAMKEAKDYITANPAEAARIVAASITNDTEAIETMAMPFVSFIVKPDEAFISGVETYAATMKTLVPLKNVLTRAEIFDLTLVNQTL